MILSAATSPALRLLSARLPARSARRRTATMASSAAQPTVESKNVLGGALEICCTNPKTGFYRDGFCCTGPTDFGKHIVCAQVTAEFLDYSKSKGNDLMTPRPEYSFPGLKPGDRWCLCVSRWEEARVDGCAPPVFLRACQENSLGHIEGGLDTLQKFALPSLE